MCFRTVQVVLNANRLEPRLGPTYEGCSGSSLNFVVLYSFTKVSDWNSSTTDTEHFQIYAWCNTWKLFVFVLNIGFHRNKGRGRRSSPFLAHLAHSAKVSFWDHAVSVVVRRPSSVVRRASTIYLNIFFSKTTDGKVIKLCIDVPKMVPYINCSNGSIPWRTLVAMATDRKMFKNLTPLSN